jgi:hypothetical protein
MFVGAFAWSIPFPNQVISATPTVFFQTPCQRIKTFLFLLSNVMDSECLLAGACRQSAARQ